MSTHGCRAASGDALARLSISLNHMLGRLRESVQTSRRFLADASHELRTPLTVIKGELQEVVRTETMSQALPRSHRQRPRRGSRASNTWSLVFWYWSRLGCGRSPARMGRCGPGRAFGWHGRARLRLMAIGIEAFILVSAALRPVVVHRDRARLKQVNRHLLDNAIRFTPRAAPDAGSCRGRRLPGARDPGYRHRHTRRRAAAHFRPLLPRR